MLLFLGWYSGTLHSDAHVYTDCISCMQGEAATVQAAVELAVRAAVDKTNEAARAEAARAAAAAAASAAAKDEQMQAAAEHAAETVREAEARLVLQVCINNT